MKTISSLIASSTIGIAAAGLALGKRESPQLNKARSTIDALNQNHDQLPSLSSRPDTSFSNINVIDFHYPSVCSQESRTTSTSKSHRRPPLSHVNRARNTYYRRPTSSLNIDSNSLHEILPDEDKTVESVSSKSSWMRRLSSRPTSNSQQESTNSHSPRTASSNTLWSQNSYKLRNGSVSIPCNRLVKRPTRERAVSGSENSNRPRSFSTLRRPFTSHQRMYISQHHPEIFNEIHKGIGELPLQNESIPQLDLIWHPYFEDRSIQSFRERKSENVNGRRQPKLSVTCNKAGNSDTGIPTLINPRMILDQRDHYQQHNFRKGFERDHSRNEENEDIVKTDTPVSTPSSRVENSTKFLRRSLSVQFKSPISRISRPGSIGGLRLKTEGKFCDRFASVLASGIDRPASVSAYSSKNKDANFYQNGYQQKLLVTVKGRPSYDSLIEKTHVRSRNNSSPLLYLSRLSTLSIDLDQIGLSSSSSSSSSFAPQQRLNFSLETEPYLHPKTDLSTISLSSAVQIPNTDRTSCMAISLQNDFPNSDIADPATTLAESNLDMKGFISGDDDDTDFHSETVFDSMRSGATAITQPPKLPIEFMFDASPSILSDYSRVNKNKTYENLEDSKFQRISEIEVDSVMNTSKNDNLSVIVQLDPSHVKAHRAILSEYSTCSIPKVYHSEMNISQTHLDAIDGMNDLDEDWTEEENFLEHEIQSTHKLNSYHLRREDTRTLSSSSSDQIQIKKTENPRLDKTKSNVFDWSEPSISEKLYVNGHSSRPRTAHIKQIMNGRSGRVIGRRGPTALHIRSQSVPVVPDTEISKLTSKFGTWGLSPKAVSEDWDGDFEFGNANLANLPGGESTREIDVVQVPEAIKANQKNIVGHVGQIREVCLLVEDLKRLRALGKSQGLLHGEFEPLWLQAEGIIALAAPVEEEENEIFQKEYSHSSEHDCSSAIQDTQFESLREKSKSGVYLGQETPPISSKKIRVTNASLSHEKIIHPLASNFLSANNNNSTEVARKMMESINQQRSNSDPLLQKLSESPSTKMPFDTTSLKDLVNRAAALSRALGQVVRTAEGLTISSEIRLRDSSPAFTRMFTDPMIVSPGSSSHEKSNASNSSDPIESSPIQIVTQRMHMMAVT